MPETGVDPATGSRAFATENLRRIVQERQMSATVDDDIDDDDVKMSATVDDDDDLDMPPFSGHPVSVSDFYGNRINPIMGKADEMENLRHNVQSAARTREENEQTLR